MSDTKLVLVDPEFIGELDELVGEYDYIRLGSSDDLVFDYRVQPTPTGLLEIEKLEDVE
jgi:hypothetical protein